MPIKGIDVSKYQGNIDWKKVKDDGVKFAFIRVGWCGYNGKVTLDEKYHTNMKNAIANGIDVGVYLYSYATSVDSARIAAKEVLELVKPYRLTYPIAFDIEETQSKIYTKNSKFQNNAICEGFLSTIEDAGYYAMLYTYTYFTSSYLDMSKLTRYDVWIADYRGQLGYKGVHGIWQYSSKGRVNGISGNVDMNHGYRDYAELIPRLGLNNLKPVVVKPTKPKEVFYKIEVYFDKKEDALKLKEALNALKTGAEVYPHSNGKHKLVSASYPTTKRANEVVQALRLLKGYEGVVMELK